MPSQRLRLLALGAIGVLAMIVVGLGVVFVAMRTAPSPATNGRTAIEISATACTPNDVTVPAGPHTFAIHNASTGTIEWEILSGVMVLAERENIAPGFTIDVTPTLAPGTYAMTCGLLSNPHGKLTVLAANGTTEAAPTRPTLDDLVAPTAEYRVYAISTANALTAATAAIVTALKNNDLGSARQNAAAAQADFARIAPLGHLFARDASPLDTGITSLAVLNRDLATTPLPDGIDRNARTIASSAANLGGTIHSSTASPHEIVAGAGLVVADLAKGFDDPALAADRLAGVRKVIELFQPLTRRADPALAGRLDADLAAADAALAKSPPDATAAKASLGDLAADLTAMLAALGLNAT